MSTQIQEIQTPQAIEERSLQIIDSEVPEPRPFSGFAWEIARRLIHTTADFDLLNHIYFSNALSSGYNGEPGTPDAISAGLAALARGCTIFTDTEMVRCGIPHRRLEPLGAKALCLLSLPSVDELAQKENRTRSHVAMTLAAPLLDGNIIAIGNAPTALLRLMEMLDKGYNPPALVIAMPVGFVNAAESKELFFSYNVPFITIKGRKGGSPLAAATVNALANIALRKRD